MSEGGDSKDSCTGFHSRQQGLVWHQETMQAVILKDRRQGTPIPVSWLWTDQALKTSEEALSQKTRYLMPGGGQYTQELFIQTRAEMTVTKEHWNGVFMLL